MEWYLKVVKDNYANFNGRARRKEYWMYVLFSIIIYIILGILDNIFDLKVGRSFFAEYSDVDTGYGLLTLIYALATIIPGLAVTVRRLHDVNKSGWNYLWNFVCIGGLYVLYLNITEGDHGPNNYGADPKSDENDHDPFAGQRGEHNSFTSTPPPPPSREDHS